MKSYSARLAVLLAGCWLASAPTAFAEAIPPWKDAGFDVLTRGPLHEAFAQPSTLKAEVAPIVPKQPPQLIEEEPPAQKPEGANVQWIGGYWSWDDERKDFLWVSGFWRDVPPGREWVPGYWTQLADGWQRVPGFWGETGQTEYQFLTPPPDSLENGPVLAAPADDYFYVPGSWTWRTRYLWRPGYWLRYRPGWVWVPARYIWTPSGFIYVSGYWDYPLESRGVLFAPVYFRRPLWDLVAGWLWRPSYVVYSPGLFGSLFVRPGWGYYYGDYFGPRYAGLGFTPWLDFRLGGFGHDPLFNYYRWHHRGDRNWQPALTALYADRFAGRAALPPRTFAQQTQIVQNTTTNATNIRNLTIVAPVTQVTQTGVKLQTITPTQVIEQRDAVRRLRTFSEQRRHTESQLITSTPTTTAPRVAKFDVPKSPTAAHATTSFVPPVTGTVSSGLPRSVTSPTIKSTDTTPRSLTLPSHTQSSPATGSVIQRSITPSPVIQTHPAPSGRSTPTPPPPSGGSKNVGSGKDKSLKKVSERPQKAAGSTAAVQPARGAATSHTVDKRAPH
jgi:hypothetical protein